MVLSIEGLKGVNLVEFLSQHYHLKFRHMGGQWVCHSPFTNEKSPSFFVRMVNGHWLFKDFSSGFAGSIFDFVRIKENLRDFSEALKHVCRLVSGVIVESSEGGAREGTAHISYDVKRLYGQFRGLDLSPCRAYLLKRGISEELIHCLVTEGNLLHNRYKGRSYCCFAVRNSHRELQCLDNHQIDGPDKFVLGRKTVFTRDWDVLPRAERVFICEGIIDYLSVKTMEDDTLAGLALLGNQVRFDPGLISGAHVIISALDHDRGGYGALYDLGERFADKKIEPYDLEGHKDPNELLMAIKEGKGRRLSPEKKLRLYQEFIQSSNKSELARKWGVDRSYMYDIVRECEQIVLETFTGRKPGRKPKGKPSTLDEAWQRIEQLEEQYEREATEKERLYCRSEFLKLRLKWSQIEAAELRGEPVDDSKGPPVKKKQIKKKRKSRS